MMKLQFLKFDNQISLNINFLIKCSMTSYLSYNYKKPSTSHGLSSCDSKKKIKHFSYSSNDKIGKGFSSIVYKGTNQLTNQIVAIKAIDMKGIKDSISRQMLDCQIQALTTLNHSNILKCYDVIREISHCFIITEFCNQGDLSDALKKKRRFSQNQTHKILKDIVNGFIEMGERRFLHRDLKLANIFLSEGNAIIADFGFAKKHSNSSERQKYNVGSPLYMSPEALKKNIYSIKNDIWSIGIMAFEMLHGETPWECRTQKQLIDKMTRIPVKFRDSLNISSPMKDFIKKCLQVDERKRMSLQELKEWFHNSHHHKGQNQQVPPLRKPFSNIQNLINPLGQITNKFSARDEKSKSLVGNRPDMMNKQNYKDRQSFKSKQNKFYNNNKQNNPNGGKGVSLVSLPKSLIQANNNILVIQINTFRLIYKIMQKVRKYEPHAVELSKVLGAEVLKRVKNLKSFCCDEDQNGKVKLSLLYGIKQAESYLNEIKNPSIKKYKSVVKEYFKKYTSEIKVQEGQHVVISPIQLVKQHLRQKGYLSSRELSSDEMTYIYWMIQLVLLRKDVKKQFLDEIIDPKHLQLNKQYLQDRVKQFC